MSYFSFTTHYSSKNLKVALNFTMMAPSPQTKPFVSRTKDMAAIEQNENIECVQTKCKEQKKETVRRRHINGHHKAVSVYSDNIQSLPYPRQDINIKLMFMIAKDD